MLGANVATSLVAHRAGRTETPDATDALDLAAIAAWAIFNTVLIVCVVDTRPLMVVAAVCAAVAVVVMDVLRRNMTWRCHQRNAVHAAMHVVGSAGTVVLLLA